MATNVNNIATQAISAIDNAASSVVPVQLVGTASPIQIQGIDTRNGAVFVRTFPNYAAMQQWVATDPNADNYDFSAPIVRPANAVQ